MTSRNPSLSLPHLIPRIAGRERAALLTLVGLDKMLPSRWTNVKNEHVWVLFMHSRCNLPAHVEYSATTVKYDAISGLKLLLAWPPTPESRTTRARFAHLRV